MILRKRSIILSVLVVLALIVIYLVHAKSLSATIQLDVAPTDAKIYLNGRRLKPSSYHVKPGHYSVSFKRDGFYNIDRYVDVAKRQALFVGEALLPKDLQLANWYTAHPKDQKIAEGISSKNFDSLAAQQITQAPFLAKLPYINIEPYYKIDYGVSKKFPSDPSKFAIYIYSNSDNAKKEALTWIRTQGGDPSRLELIYP